MTLDTLLAFITLLSLLGGILYAVLNAHFKAIARLDDASHDLHELSGNVKEYADKIDLVVKRTDAHETRIVENERTIKVVQADVSANREQISLHDNRLTTIESHPALRVPPMEST